MAPNKLAEAKKQTENLKGIKIPGEINVFEAHLFHVLMIESTPNAKTLEYDHKVKVQTYDEKSWEVNKDILPRLGYVQNYILHDPVLYKAQLEKAKEEAGKVAFNELKEAAKEFGMEVTNSTSTKDIMNFMVDDATRLSMEEPLKATQKELVDYIRSNREG